ncbi:MAG: zf-HC2 domain-containing protein [Acidobacteriota bacterium]
MTDEYADRIASYLHGELSEAEAREMRQHIAQCKECEQEAADFERILKSIEEERVPERLSPHTRRRILSKASRDLKVRRMPTMLRLFWQQPGLLAAAALLLVGIGWITTRGLWQPSAPAQIAEKPKSVAPEMSRPAQPPSVETSQLDTSKSKVALPASEVSKSSEMGGRKLDYAPSDLKDKKGTDAETAAPKEVAAREPFSPAPPPPAESSQKLEVEAAGGKGAPEAADEVVNLANRGQSGDMSSVGRDAMVRQEEARQRAAAVTPAPASNAPQGEVEGKVQQVPGAAAGEEQQRAAEKDNAPAQAQQVAKSVPRKVQDQYARQLDAAAKLLAAGKKPQAEEAYRKLLRDYPERRNETLASISDTTVAERLKAQ